MNTKLLTMFAAPPDPPQPPGRGLEYLGEGGWSTLERGLEYLETLEHLREVEVPGGGGWGNEE